MKILMISSNYPPLLGGSAASVPYLSAELSRRGFEVHALTQGYPNLPKTGKQDGFFIHRGKIVRGKHWLPYIVLPKVISMASLGRKIIKKERINLIHSHDLNISGLVGWFANKAKIPSICKFGGNLVWEYTSFTKWKNENPEKILIESGWGVKFFEIIQRKISDYYNLIAPNSLYQLKWLETFTGIPKNKLVLLRNGIAKNKIEFIFIIFVCNENN